MPGRPVDREDSAVATPEGEACRRAMSSRNAVRVEAEAGETTGETGGMAEGAGGRAEERAKKGEGANCVGRGARRRPGKVATAERRRRARDAGGEGKRRADRATDQTVARSSPTMTP